MDRVRVRQVQFQRNSMEVVLHQSPTDRQQSSIINHQSSIMVIVYTYIYDSEIVQFERQKGRKVESNLEIVDSGQRISCSSQLVAEAEDGAWDMGIWGYGIFIYFYLYQGFKYWGQGQRQRGLTRENLTQEKKREWRQQTCKLKERKKTLVHMITF